MNWPYIGAKQVPAITPDCLKGESQPTDTLARITSCCSELIREWVQKGSFGRICVQVCGEAEQTHFQVTWLAFFVTPLFQITHAAWLQPRLSSLSCLVSKSLLFSPRP